MGNPRSFDVLGSIAIVKFPEGFKVLDKKKFAKKLLEEHKAIETVVEKARRVKGRLRKAETRHLAGAKTKEVLYKENNCVFRFDIDSTYFSPRLSNERKEIANKRERSNASVIPNTNLPYRGTIVANIV